MSAHRRTDVRRLRLPPGPRVGLRTRVGLAFAAGWLGMSMVLALATLALARGYLLEQRHQASIGQATVHARTVVAAMRTSRPAYRDLLTRLDADGGSASAPLLRVAGRWHDAQLDGGVQVLPAAFLDAARTGRPVTQRVEIAGDPALAVALPLEHEDAAATYVEVFALDELDDTLSTLSVVLVATAAATTLMGLLLGRWAARRTLRPLAAVSAAADEVAQGNLATRLDVDGDPDLSGLAAAFNETTARLERRVERDARFASNVSHELRSPMTTLVNAVELLEAQRSDLPDPSREVVELLGDEVHRLAKMVDDLLEISRPDKAAVLRCEPLHLATLVPLVTGRRTPPPPTVVEPGAERLVLLGDKRRLEQVLVNLLDNADRHAGGASSVRVERGAGVLRICVEDRGPGVAAPDREAIFERFSRGGGQGRGSGTGVGLGLALVHEHVRAHRGRVWVEDRRGGGARFVVELPVG